MKKTKIILGALCLICIANYSSAANDTYSGNKLENRLDRIEKDLRILNKEVYRNGVSPLSAFTQKQEAKENADFEIRLSTLEENIRKTKGEIEAIQYKNTLLEKQMEKLQKDVDFRLNTIESTPKLAPVVKTEEKTNPPKVDLSAFNKKKEETKKTETTPLSSETSSPEEQYKNAFDLLKEQKFEEAEKAFSKFLSEHKDHELAGNAQYWKAETFYVRGDMEEAMKQFVYGYKNYKNSSKATDNLLKLAMTLRSNGRIEDACITLQELETKYQPLAENITSRLKDEKTKNKCSY